MDTGRSSGPRRAISTGSLSVAFALLASACGVGAVGHGYRHIPKDSALIIGTTDHVPTLDPAGAYENGSWTLYAQIYPFLLNFPYRKNKLAPDAAQHCEFAEPTRYRCVLRPRLTFANGHPLTSTSVKFSFDRMRRIDDPNGPQSLLENLVSVQTPDPRTVDFILKLANDQTFPQVLAANVGPILDERVFPVDRILGDEAVVAGQPFGGPYAIAKYRKNDVALLQARPDYQGIYQRPATANIVFKYYANAGNLKLDVLKHQVDVAFRALSISDYAQLDKNPAVKVWRGIGGEMRYIAFNKGSQPGRNDEQKLAVRKAVAASVDRAALARDVYQGMFDPAWSVVPAGFDGSVPAFREAYGDRPDKAKAAGFLKAAGVATPVTLRLQYTAEHYGPSSSEEYALVKSQLEATGLFRVELQSTEWGVYQHEYAAGSYPLFQLGWYPDFPDPDNYLTPFFVQKNFISNGFFDPVVGGLLDSERTDPDPARRGATIAQAQRRIAQDVISVVPLLVGRQIMVTGTYVAGVPEAIDGTYKLLVGSLRISGKRPA
ncbi:ABC transporter substrate-binding protein [Segniliparus rugosus]|uniref:Solute-binding protein family 5 domain-containing protein n=1 Tax=Segniliparus rugosus (strain ATCC BAA-974 / DSM 45345 / CCUG 50838 / CIP 108380 / JCM 13579 / CDC 945) TaxID=679197 RepID=U1LN46_SEGRC|nr:ABC transporter substrate-binding protein [Segniliparus rugosus]ERG69366.1 hypothetical protein HMPREF9336_04062 [Segniliparus rugosus ATCC BAA-974]